MEKVIALEREKESEQVMCVHQKVRKSDADDLIAIQMNIYSLLFML